MILELKNAQIQAVYDFLELIGNFPPIQTEKSQLQPTRNVDMLVVNSNFKHEELKRFGYRHGAFKLNTMPCLCKHRLAI